MSEPEIIKWSSLDGRDAILAATLELAGMTRRSLHIYSQDLDAPFYDTDGFLRAAAALLNSSPRAEVRILVKDANPAVRADHRLIELHRQYQSRLRIREPARQHQGYKAAFLVADGIGVLYRESADRMYGAGSPNDRPRARQLLRYHDEVWEHALENPNLRRLHL